MTDKQFNESVTDSIKNLVNKAKQSDNWEDLTESDQDKWMTLNAHLTTSFSQWLERNGDSIDIGGNWTPDKVAANHERYAQQGEKQSIPF